MLPFIVVRFSAVVLEVLARASTEMFCLLKKHEERSRLSGLRIKVTP